MHPRPVSYTHLDVYKRQELVVVVESPVSEARMRDMFKVVDSVLREHAEVGAYNQTI